MSKHNPPEKSVLKQTLPKGTATRSKTGSLATSNFDRLFGTTQGSRNASGLMLIDRDHIDTSAQPRTHFDEQALADLTASIQERKAKGEGVEGTGILQPLLVAAVEGGNGRFRLIAGERRYRAAGAAGLEQVPAILVPLHESELLATQMIENLQRADLTVLEEARALGDLVASRGLSVREAAQVLGKDRGWVQNRLRLLKVSPDVLKMVSFRNDSLPHAFEIDAVANKALRKALIEATRNGASVAEIRRRIDASRQDASPQQDTSPQIGRNTTSESGADSDRGTFTGSVNSSRHAKEDSTPEDSTPLAAGNTDGTKKHGGTGEATLGTSSWNETSHSSLQSATTLISRWAQLLRQEKPSARERKEILKELARLQKEIDFIRAKLS